MQASVRCLCVSKTEWFFQPLCMWRGAHECAGRGCTHTYVFLHRALPCCYLETVSHQSRRSPLWVGWPANKLLWTLCLQTPYLIFTWVLEFPPWVFMGAEHVFLTVGLQPSSLLCGIYRYWWDSDLFLWICSSISVWKIISIVCHFRWMCPSAFMAL